MGAKKMKIALVAVFTSSASMGLCLPADATVGIGFDAVSVANGRTYGFVNFILGLSSPWIGPTLKIGMYPRDLLIAGSNSQPEQTVTFADGGAYKAEFHLLFPGDARPFHIPSTRWTEAGRHGIFQVGPYVRAVKYDFAPRKSTLFVSGGLGGKIGYSYSDFTTALLLNVPMVRMVDDPVTQPDLGLSFELRF
ncbi:MAG TPA: hypothetical protein DD435_01345 [Cyanobacteria bacterium UBA8530]|nr:hypothetical protein [Cyanobacteria bacterium UBA8530]